MQARVYFSFVLLFLVVVCRAQAPQYTAGAATAGNYFPLGSTDGKGTRVQLLYKPSDFAALPTSGTVTRIYFKVDNSTESEGPASYTNLTLRIATTSLSSLPSDGGSFTMPLTTVFEAVEYQTHFKRGQWIGFTLQQPFSYSDTANLIIDISVAHASALRYLGFANSNGTRRVWGTTGSDHADGSDGKLYALGLDVSPAPVTTASVVPMPVADEDHLLLRTPDTDSELSYHDTPAPVTLSQTEYNAAQIKSETEATPARRNGNKWFVLGTALLAALGIGTLFPLLPRTRKLASWAVHNPNKAKGWLFGLQFLGSVAALYTGIKLYDYGIITSDASTTALLALSTIATMLYPRRNRRTDMWKGYARQKMAGGLVVASGFGLLAGVGNRCAADEHFCRPASYVVTQMDAQHYERSARGTYDKPVNTGDLAWKIIASIMILALLAALLFGVAVLACGVYCVIALEATSTATIVGGAIAGGVVGGLGVFGVVKLFLYFKRVIWGRKYRN